MPDFLPPQDQRYQDRRNPESCSQAGILASRIIFSLQYVDRRFGHDPLITELLGNPIDRAREPSQILPHTVVTKREDNLPLDKAAPERSYPDRLLLFPSPLMRG